MSEQIGVIVLQRVLEHYENHPGSWVRGYGTLWSIFYASVDDVTRRLAKPGQTGCVYTMITAYAAVVAGDGGKEAAAEDAIRVFCAHHKKPANPHVIRRFNDKFGLTQWTTERVLRGAIADAVSMRAT